MKNNNIYVTIANIMNEVTAITKSRQNQQQHFAYRGIDDVMNELHPIMAKCGLFVVPEVLHEERNTQTTSKGSIMNYTRLTVKFTFYAVDGSNISAIVIGEAMDSGDKASNKALSIALKYALLQVFMIPTEDDKDPDAQSWNQPLQQVQQVQQPQQQSQNQYSLKDLFNEYSGILQITQCSNKKSYAENIYEILERNNASEIHQETLNLVNWLRANGNKI